MHLTAILNPSEVVHHKQESKSGLMVRPPENADVHHSRVLYCTYSSGTIQVKKTFPTKLIGRGNSAPASVNVVSCFKKYSMEYYVRSAFRRLSE
jgi:hypothetical protein